MVATAEELARTPTRCAQVSAHLPGDWELIRGKGYLYFAGGGDQWETHSVMTPRLSDQTLGEWLADFAFARELD